MGNEGSLGIRSSLGDDAGEKRDFSSVAVCCEGLGIILQEACEESREA